MEDGRLARPGWARVLVKSTITRSEEPKTRRRSYGSNTTNAALLSTAIAQCRVVRFAIRASDCSCLGWIKESGFLDTVLKVLGYIAIK
jgi:hypothetical protein